MNRRAHDAIGWALVVLFAPFALALWIALEIAAWLDRKRPPLLP